MELEFTGERLVPGRSGDMLETEHLQRYEYVLPLAKGKVVLDAACGEGYGSALLASKAAHVIGIDLAEDVILWAREKYHGYENLKFLCEDICRMPFLENQSVDLIVSFETIEHLTAEGQIQFVEECKRVLKPDGIFVCSTPNRQSYSKGREEKNPYHLHELGREEFRKFLQEFFSSVQYLVQTPVTASMLIPEKDSKVGELYMLAIASGQSLPEQKEISLLPENPHLRKRWAERLRKLREENDQLRKETEEQKEENRQLRRETEEQKEENHQIREETEKQEKENRQLRKETEKQKEENRLLRQELNRKEEKIQRLNERVQEFQTIQCYRSYRIGQKLHQYSLRVVPGGSKRRKFVSLLWNGIHHPGEYRKEFREDCDQDQSEGQEPLLCPGFPSEKHPRVSIVIPVYYHFSETCACLQSVQENTEGVPYEVILADDGSEERARQQYRQMENLRIITNKEQMGYLRNVNHAARSARGEYLLLLNNDTKVQKGWLSALLRVFEEEPLAGIAGAKLLNEDGRLQEAGGIVWKDGSAWNYGRGEDPEFPSYQYKKQVDYVSGACLMIPKKLWTRLGGYDRRYTPAYYEDTDLAFQVRALGYQVYYQPLAQVVHLEGISHGKSENSGVKQVQKNHQEVFAAKWEHPLKKEHFSNGKNVFLARDRSRGKRRILVIDHYVPEYDHDAGGRCSYMWLRLFVKMGFQVTFLGDNFYRSEPYTAMLNQMGIEVLFGNWYQEHWKEWMKAHLKEYAYVYLQRPHIAVKYIDWIRRYSSAKVFYFAHDLHFLRLKRQYEVTGDETFWQQSEKMRETEETLFRKAEVIHVVGSVEQEILQRRFPDKKVRNIPLYLYEQIPKIQKYDYEKRKDLLFVGGFGHPPNEDGLLWFVSEIFPKICEEYPGIVLHVAGGKGNARIQALECSQIHLYGNVSEEFLQSLYHSCRMAVVPLRFGAGVKGKVVEAAYYQLPVVTTACGAEGIPEKGSYLTVSSAEEMAKEVCRLYRNPKILEKMASAGALVIRKYYTMQHAREILEEDL